MGFPAEFWDRYAEKMTLRKGSQSDYILELEDFKELFSIIDSFIVGKVRLITIVCYPIPKSQDLTLEYHFTDEHTVVSLKIKVPEGKVVPSLTPKLPAAGWAEREIMDLFDVKFDGHPNPARLIIPDDMERGVYLRS